MIINNRATHRWPRKRPTSRSSSSRNRSQNKSPTVPKVKPRWSSALEQYLKDDVKTPLSTRQTLVFPYDLEKKMFDTSSYSLIKDDNVVTLQETEQFLRTISGPVAKFEEEYGNISRWSGWKWFGFLILSIIILPMCLCVLPIKFANWELSFGQFYKCRVEAQKMVQSKNDSLKWTKKGVEWKIPAVFPRWIELHTGIPPEPKPEDSTQLKSEDATQSGFGSPGISEQVIQIQIITPSEQSDQEKNKIENAV